MTGKMSQASLGSAMVPTLTLRYKLSIYGPQFPHLYRDGLSSMGLFTYMVLEGFCWFFCFFDFLVLFAFSQGVQLKGVY